MTHHYDGTPPNFFAMHTGQGAMGNSSGAADDTQYRDVAAVLNNMTNRVAGDDDDGDDDDDDDELNLDAGGSDIGFNTNPLGAFADAAGYDNLDGR